MLYQLSYTPKADCDLRRPRGEIKRRFAGFVWFCKKPDATHPVMDIDRPSAPEIFARAPWTHVAKTALAATHSVPTMLGPQEQQFYYWLTSVWARGDGAVVDLGCCAGGSTARLAAGAADSGLNTRIAAYDRFTAAEPLKQTLLYANGIETFAGNDLLPLAERLLSPWSDRIDLIPGEIEDNAWDGGPIELSIGAIGDTSGLTQLSDTFAPTAIVKNGSPVGNLTGVEIDENGFVHALYDSGFTRTIYQIPLADVPNPNGLEALSNQVYQVSSDSGAFFLWDAGDGPTGEVVGYAREESATDVAAELTQLIQTQRAYSSNAKIIQTVDEMLQETTNIKR